MSVEALVDSVHMLWTWPAMSSSPTSGRPMLTPTARVNRLFGNGGNNSVFDFVALGLVALRLFLLWWLLMVRWLLTPRRWRRSYVPTGEGFLLQHRSTPTHLSVGLRRTCLLRPGLRCHQQTIRDGESAVKMSGVL